MGVPSKNSKKKAISHGRPPLLKPLSAALSSRATRSIIGSHHKLYKEYSKAVDQGDAARATQIKHAIDNKGGLKKYQIASTLGQSSTRGGDSSKVLVGWLRETVSDATPRNVRFRVLEIGALSTKNAVSQVECLDVTRIDLHSQEPGIREIDFMRLPVPAVEGQRYHIISLSLVLNFVPNAAGRGAMLRRILDFLVTDYSEQTNRLLPCLFLVLPLPCVANSRYLTESRLEQIMTSLGFSSIRVKKTTKLYYSLWKYACTEVEMSMTVKKKELRSGSSRNNFAIVLR